MSYVHVCIYIYFTKLVAADHFVTSLNFQVYNIIRHALISSFPIIYFNDFSFVFSFNGLDSKIKCSCVIVCSNIV